MWEVAKQLSIAVDAWFDQHFFHLLIGMVGWRVITVLDVIVKRLDHVVRALGLILERLPRR